MIDIYMTEMHPYYQIWVDGQIYDQFTKSGHPLSFNEIDGIVAGYREWFEGEPDE